MLTEAQKVGVRRHLGYGPVGLPQTGGFGGSFISYRFFVHHGLMEYRINNLSPEEEAVLLNGNTANNTVLGNPGFPDPTTDGQFINGYLSICDFLEGRIATADDNLDTDKAGEWTARKEEIQQRTQLYEKWCYRLARFLYLPLGKSEFEGARGALVN